MFKLQNIQVKLTVRYTKVHVISFQRLCRPRPNNHQATVSESAPVKLGMLCSKALDHKFEFGQVQIATHFTDCTTALRPMFGHFYCIVIFSQFPESLIIILACLTPNDLHKLCFYMCIQLAGITWTLPHAKYNSPKPSMKQH